MKEERGRDRKKGRKEWGKEEGRKYWGKDGIRERWRKEHSLVDFIHVNINSTQVTKVWSDVSRFALFRKWFQLISIYLQRVRFYCRPIDSNVCVLQTFPDGIRTLEDHLILPRWWTLWDQNHCTLGFLAI